jgi:hypothetical protein
MARAKLRTENANRDAKTMFDVEKCRELLDIGFSRTR